MNRERFSRSFGTILMLTFGVALMLLLGANSSRETSLQVAGVNGQIRVAPTIISYPTCPPSADTSPLSTLQVAESRGEECLSVYKRRGPIIAEGTNSTPSSRYRLKSYRVEDIVLPGPITCTVFVPDPVHGEYHTPTLTFDKVWHLIITADRIFYPNEMRWEVFLDGVLLGRGLPSSEGEITVTVYDKTMLREGATIGVSYDDRAKPEYTLPEKLHFNRAP